MSDKNVAGYSISQADIDALPYEVHPAPKASGSARLLADKYHRENPEPLMDPRLKSGLPAEHHRAEVREALTAAGYKPLRPTDLPAALSTVEVDEPVRSAVVRILAAQVDAKPLVPRSADAIAAAHRAKQG
jgi:hypothetical protein